MAERDVPEVEGSYKQVISIPPVRSYLRERTEGESTTISQYLYDEVLPEDYGEITLGDHEVAHIKVTPPVDERIDGMTGPRVRKGDTLAYFVLRDALERGDLRLAQEVAEYLPVIFWGVEGDP